MRHALSIPRAPNALALYPPPVRRHGVRRTVRFVGVGVISTLTNFAMSFCLVGFFQVDVKIANAIAYMTGMAVSYFGHRHVTFKSQGSVVREGWKFVVMHGCNLALSTLVLTAMVDGFRINRYVALVVANVFVMISSFLVMQFWVFRAQSAGPAAMPESSDNI
jgi:putative flippase GtrA